MANETTITLTGNLTADPELRHTNTGTPVASFTIATTPRTYNRTSGQWEDGTTLFMRCNAWQTLAETITETLHKGQKVTATGRLEQRSWEKDGQKHTTIETRIDTIALTLTPQRDTNKPTQNRQTPQNPTQGWGNENKPVESSSTDPWILPDTPAY